MAEKQECDGVPEHDECDDECFQTCPELAKKWDYRYELDLVGVLVTLLRPDGSETKYGCIWSHNPPPGDNYPYDEDTWFCDQDSDMCHPHPFLDEWPLPPPEVLKACDDELRKHEAELTTELENEGQDP